MEVDSFLVRIIQEDTALKQESQKVGMPMEGLDWNDHWTPKSEIQLMLNDLKKNEKPSFAKNSSLAWDMIKGDTYDASVCEEDASICEEDATASEEDASDCEKDASDCEIDATEVESTATDTHRTTTEVSNQEPWTRDGSHYDERMISSISTINEPTSGVENTPSTMLETPFSFMTLDEERIVTADNTNNKNSSSASYSISRISNISATPSPPPTDFGILSPTAITTSATKYTPVHVSSCAGATPPPPPPFTPFFHDNSLVESKDEETQEYHHQLWLKSERRARYRQQRNNGYQDQLVVGGTNPPPPTRAQRSSTGKAWSNSRSYDRAKTSYNKNETKRRDIPPLPPKPISHALQGDAKKALRELRLRLHGSRGTIKVLEGKVQAGKLREESLITEVKQLKKQLAAATRKKQKTAKRCAADCCALEIRLANNTTSSGSSNYDGEKDDGYIQFSLIQPELSTTRTTTTRSNSTVETHLAVPASREEEIISVLKKRIAKLQAEVTKSHVREKMGREAASARQIKFETLLHERESDIDRMRNVIETLKRNISSLMMLSQQQQQQQQQLHTSRATAVATTKATNSVSVTTGIGRILKPSSKKVPVVRKKSGQSFHGKALTKGKSLGKATTKKTVTRHDGKSRSTINTIKNTKKEQNWKKLAGRTNSSNKTMNTTKKTKIKHTKREHHITDDMIDTSSLPSSAATLVAQYNELKTKMLK